MQHVEAEKLLLVATQKRQCALHEIQRLKAEGALGKRSYWTEDEDSCRGSISIGHITLPLKQDFLDKSPMEKQVHHFLVLVKHRDQVIASQLLTTPDCIVEGAVTFPNLMALHSLTADFNISLEVYEFKIDPQGATSFKKEHSRMKLTPLKRLHKESKVFSPAVSSPGGPYSIRSSSFTLIGFANLNINTLTRNAWTLEKVPFNSPMNGHLLMRVCASMEGGVSEKTFLTMFDDVGGYGAWNRRWCVLNGPSISYWSYPDDENKKESLGVLDLRMCTTRKVELVSRDVCARQFTFQLTFMRPLKRGDVTDLIHEVKGNTLITRILLSADSKEERILWCNKLNKSLANVRAWDPDSLKPEDFHV
ncbi:UNVERIFIED_CONTAM: hypothetical protein GTU68_024644 [Idotea baltica]|nr:hypothetical protein [Idotea baltica]